MSSKSTTATKEQIESTIRTAADSLWDMMMDKDQYDVMPNAARPMVEAAIRQLVDAIQIVRK